MISFRYHLVSIVAGRAIVSKQLDAPYSSGRGDAWTKAKCRGGHEVVIGGWTTTDGRFRSLLVGAHRGRHLVYIGRVGTGFGQAVVARLLPADLDRRIRSRGRRTYRLELAAAAVVVFSVEEQEQFQQEGPGA